MAVNPNKWAYAPNDVTIVLATLDGIAVGMECDLEYIEGKEAKDTQIRKANSIHVGIRMIREMHEQQTHLIKAIEKLKKQLEK